jgi:cbb3-type cytochrome oxidase subunit 3
LIKVYSVVFILFYLGVLAWARARNL